MPIPDVSVTVDETRKLIIMRLKGRESSAWFTDRMLDAYRGIDELWRYNRMIDHRHFTGFIAFEDLERLRLFWVDVMQGRSEKPRVALVTHDALAHARVSSSGSMFKDASFRSFSSGHEAMDWVTAVPVAY